MLARWDRVYVCSELDRAELEPVRGRRYGSCRTSSPCRRPVTGAGDEPFTFLFVGNLDYFPNRDGVRWFCAEVLPHLRARSPRRRSASSSSAAAGRSRRRSRNSRSPGPSADVGPWYAAAAAAVVPLRVGGGTRIKILEAFAHGVPVVSTPLGAEGLAVEDGTHLLAAEDAEGFARRCVELMKSPALADGLRDRARRLVVESYSLDAAAEAVAPAAARPR